MGFLKKLGRSVSKFAKDPSRILMAGATFGLSEVARAATPGLPGMPGLPGTPTMADATAAGEEERRQASRRGRASTILTGGQGLAGSTATLASRALFGPGGSQEFATPAQTAAMATPEQQGAGPAPAAAPRPRRRDIRSAMLAATAGRFGTRQYA